MCGYVSEEAHAARRRGDSWKAKLFRQRDTIMAPVQSWQDIVKEMSDQDKTAFTDHCLHLLRPLHPDTDKITEGQYYAGVDRFQQMFDLLNKYR